MKKCVEAWEEYKKFEKHISDWIKEYQEKVNNENNLGDQTNEDLERRSKLLKYATKEKTEKESLIKSNDDMDQEFEMLSIDQVKEVETESAFIQEKVENIESLSTNVGKHLTLDKFDEDVLQNDSNLQLHEERNQMPIQHLDSDCDGSIKDEIK